MASITTASSFAPSCKPKCLVSHAWLRSRQVSQRNLHKFTLTAGLVIKYAPQVVAEIPINKIALSIESNKDPTAVRVPNNCTHQRMAIILYCMIAVTCTCACANANANASLY